MKKVNIIVCILLFTSLCFADVITKTYYFNAPDVKDDGAYTILEMEDSYHLGNPGEPSIPYRGVSLLLPQNQEISNLSIEFYDRTEIGNYTVFPTQQPMPLSLLDQAEFTPPDEMIYASDSPFPATPYTTSATHFLSGYSIGSFAFTPITYVPLTGELSYYHKAVVTIETSYSDAASQAQRFLHRNYQIEKRLASLIDNYDMIDTYHVPQAKTDGYDYIIITGSEFEDDYQVLADFHARRGLRTTIVLVSDITDTYTGVDAADQIRNYIIDQYADYPVQYILLGGDTDIVPDRGLYGYVFSSSGGTEDYDIPADMYYGCLDRSSAAGSGPDWNNNNDSYWGEYDEADFFAEVYIGRICANTGTEIANQINKIQKYLELPIVNGLESSLLVGELLWGPPSYPTYTYGGSYMNELLVGCSENGYSTVGIPGSWDVTKLYQMDYEWTSDDLFDALNQGPNFLNHLGHGTTTHCLNINNVDLTTTNLTNDGITHNFFNGYSQACYSGSLDNRTYLGTTGPDCFMKVITNMSTGAAAFVGNSRYGWGKTASTDGASQHFHRQYYDVLFETGIYSVSGANQLSKEQSVSYATNDIIRWCYYELNELGDPALELWTAEPSILTPTYPQYIKAGIPGIDVTAPAGSRIVVYDDSLIYGYGTGSGTLAFDTVPSRAGIIHIAIVSHNYYKYVGDIVVTNAVVHTNPATINVNVPVQITVHVMEPDSITPCVGVHVWAEGFDYTSETEVTDSTGAAILSVDYPYGPELNICGYIPGDDYYILNETVYVTALDFTNPSLHVTTDIGLTDTFALRLNGTIEAGADEDNIDLWVNADSSGYILVDEIVYDVTPSTITSIDAVITKPGYNIYEERFPVITVCGDVSGTVTESQGDTPVSDAEVRFYKQGSDPISNNPIFIATTDSSGVYTSPKEYVVDSYDIYITKWSFNPYQALDYFLGYGSNTYDIVIDPAGSSVVTGYVEDDAMITGATLSYVRSDNGEVFTSVQTDAGTYEVILPHFTYTITVSATGHVPYRDTCIVESNREYNYHLGFAELFDDAENGLNQWTSTGWNTTTSEYVSPTHSFADSPWGNYSSSTTTILQLDEPIDLSNITGNAEMLFATRWDIEPDYDYAQVQASIDGSTWIALEGEYTHPGAGGSQPDDEPVYDGAQLEWVEETSDLSDFAGEPQVYVRFYMCSDCYVQKDGIYVDNIIIGDPSSSYEIPITSTDDPVAINRLFLKQNFPNPMTGQATTISFSLPANVHKAELAIYNIKGQLVKTFVRESDLQDNALSFVWDGKDNNNKPVANGVYFYRLEADKKQIIKKMIIMK